MTTTHTISPGANNDAQLVEWSLTGGRNAFRQIVERYQSLICCITYNATGSLTLSEDAVKQRLARGRKLLHEEVVAFVEGALTRTAPGREFSGAVLAALPMAAASAVTAGAGAGTKGAAAAKSGVLSACLAPFIGIFAGIAAQWLMMCTGATGRERQARMMALTFAWVFAVGFSVGGGQAVQFLGQHFQWNDRTYFAAMAGFRWLFAMVMATWITIVYRRSQAAPQPGEAAGATPQPAMTPGRLALVVAGTHLMLLWCVIFLAWRAHDRMATAAIIGIMLALGIGHFFHSRGKTGAAAARAYIGQLALCSAVMLAIFNLRFDVWLAAGYGVSVAETHRLFPMWMIPLLTLALVLWTGVFLALTNPKRRLPKQHAAFPQQHTTPPS